MLCGSLVTFVIKELHPLLPSSSSQIVFYSNQSRCNLKRIYSRAIQSAKLSLFVKVYGLSDQGLLSLLSEKGKTLPTRIYYDPTASPSLEKSLSPMINVVPLKTRGLMHKKVVIIDDRLVFLGSANLTTPSLKMHDNLVIGIDSPSLACFLQGSGNFYFTEQIQNRTLHCYQLPDKQHQALNHLIKSLDDAKESIVVAMFTLTHPELLHALIRAHERHVHVHIALDHYAGNGASQKATELLLKKGIPVSFSTGRQLLHHKWAYIDGKILIMGSANWTKSAFSKNEDCLLWIENLSKWEKKFMERLTKTVRREGRILNPFQAL